MNRFSRFLGRISRGEDVILIPRTKEQWNDQFICGKWSRLTEGMPHTLFLAGLILETFPDGVRVLDIGCGNGALAKLIAGKGGIDYIGTDLSSTALAQARLIAPAGTFIEKDATDLPEDAGTCAALILSDVVMYFDIDQALPRYATQMGPDTIIFISITRSWRSPFLWRRLKKYLAIVNQYSISGSDGSYHTWDIATGYFNRTS